LKGQRENTKEFSQKSRSPGQTRELSEDMKGIDEGLGDLKGLREKVGEVSSTRAYRTNDEAFSLILNGFYSRVL
jgi:hypothetical protein